MGHPAINGSSLGEVAYAGAATSRRLELRGDRLHLEGRPLTIIFGQHGFFVGCTFVTYEAFEKLVQLESAAK